MAARAMWKAQLELGDTVVPVKLYSAIEDRAVRFNLLHAKDRQPVEQQMVDAGTGKAVDLEDAQRGMLLEEGTFVVLRPEELASLEPPASRAITVERFVPSASLGEMWFERPYWLGPDGDDDAYFALARALADEERVGIARWVMRKKRYHGALRANGDHLMLIRMRSAGEVVPAGVLSAPKGRAADAKEVALAEQLVGALAGPFDPSELAGTYEERVRELVEAKASGKVIELASYRPREADTGSLADALKASLKGVRGHG